MSKSEDGDEIADVVVPGTTIELLKRPESSSNNNKEEGRTLTSNEPKPEAKQEIQIAFNFENKSVSAKEFENKDVEQKEQKSVESKREAKSDIKPESGKGWAERVENTKRQFNNDRSESEAKEETWAKKVEGTKRAYNEDNNKAKGKSSFEIKAAKANVSSENLQTPPPEQSFGDLLKSSIKASLPSQNIIKKPNESKNNKTEVVKPTTTTKSNQNKEGLQTTLPKQSFVDLIRSTTKPPIQTPPRGPKR